MDETELKGVSVDKNRKKTIVRTSVTGILANLFLASFKAVFGIMSNSIAIVLDAVNNTSDMASSVITIIGTKLAGKAPDRKHPFGHGRVEYLTAIIISVIVLYAGVTSLVESVKKIIHPSAPEYTWITLVVVGVAVFVKIILGGYVKKVGKKVNSASLINSGEDARLDSIISATTFIAAVVYMKTGISVEAYLGAVISAIIIKSGVDMLRAGISSLLGERADSSLAAGIKETVREFENVTGVYDLVLNDYGPDTFLGSLHIEIPDTYSVNELDELLREITDRVYEKHNVILTAIGVYSVNMHDGKIVSAREEIKKIVLANDYALQIHGFYINEEKKKMRFDVVVGFDAPSRGEVYKSIMASVREKYPDYDIQIVLDVDFSDT
ncbi:MAG: cation transporter [Clostridia bacterium]|nr:cation transporter [Clostridia bacterium]